MGRKMTRRRTRRRMRGGVKLSKAAGILSAALLAHQSQESKALSMEDFYGAVHQLQENAYSLSEIKNAAQELLDAGQAKAGVLAEVVSEFASTVPSRTSALAAQAKGVASGVAATVSDAASHAKEWVYTATGKEPTFVTPVVKPEIGKTYTIVNYSGKDNFKNGDAIIIKALYEGQNTYGVKKVCEPGKGQPPLEKDKVILAEFTAGQPTCGVTAPESMPLYKLLELQPGGTYSYTPTNGKPITFEYVNWGYTGEPGNRKIEIFTRGENVIVDTGSKYPIGTAIPVVPMFELVSPPPSEEEEEIDGGRRRRRKTLRRRK